MMTDYARGDAQSPAWVAQAQMTRMPSEPFRTIPNHSEPFRSKKVACNFPEPIGSNPKLSEAIREIDFFWNRRRVRSSADFPQWLRRDWAHRTDSYGRLRKVTEAYFIINPGTTVLGGE